MDERMTLERIKPTHWMDDLGRVCTAEFMASEKAHGDYQLAYCIPCVKQGRKFVRIDDAHHPQTAQAVDVGAVREVVEDMRNYDADMPLAADHWIDKLTRAIGNAQAEGWSVPEDMALIPRHYASNIQVAACMMEQSGSVLDRGDAPILRKVAAMLASPPPPQATPNAHE